MTSIPPLKAKSMKEFHLLLTFVAICKPFKEEYHVRTERQLSS
jgi:hypothetical protein